VGSCFRRPEFGSQQIPFITLPSSGVHAPGKMERRPPICRSLRNAELPHQPLRVSRQVLAGVAFTDVCATSSEAAIVVAVGALLLWRLAEERMTLMGLVLSAILLVGAHLPHLLLALL
jgi:hypothetical protein